MEESRESAKREEVAQQMAQEKEVKRMRIVMTRLSVVTTTMDDCSYRVNQLL